MLLTCDLGNTNIKLAIYDNDNLIAFTMLDSKLIDFKSFIRSFLYKNNIREDQVDDSIMASVVPNLSETMYIALGELTHKKPFVINSKFHPGIEVASQVKDEVGADLLVISAYVHQKLLKDAIIVSMGTATVLVHVSADGLARHFIIAPGYAYLAESLYKKAAKLPEFEPVKQKSFLATDNVGAMSIGVIDGYVGMVRYLLAGLKGQTNPNAQVVGCGGMGKPIAKYITELNYYDPDLVTKGLQFIYKRYLRQWQ